jgi:ABC-type multidrug transport system fused ATPase/permease subunit
MRDIFSSLFRLLNYRERRSFWILMGIILFEAAMEIVSVSIIPAYVSLIAYQTSFPGTTALGGLIQNMVSHASHITVIIWASVVLGLFFVFKLCVSVFSVYWKARYAQNRAIKLSSRLYHAYMQAPYTFHLQHNSSELIRNINTDCMQLAVNVLIPLINMVSGGIIFAAILLVLLWNVPLGSLLLLIALLALAAFIVSRQKKTISDLGREAMHCRGEVLKILREGLGGIKEIRLLGRATFFIRHFSGEFARLMHIQRYIEILNTSIPNLVEVITIMSLLGIVLLLFLAGESSEAVLPVIAFYTVALARMKGTLSLIMQSYAQVQHNHVSLRVIQDALAELEPCNSSQPTRSEGNLCFGDTLELHNVSYRYPQAQENSLHDISLTITRGESIGFVGATGAGKSTLADVILGVLPPTAGSVMVDGTTIYDNLHSWQKNIGYVPQSLFLVDGTIRHNIALGLEPREIVEKDIQLVVRDACLIDFINKLPDGLDTVIGEKGIRLSGGQRQRIAIARAIYTNPDVLILDEGTSALDNITEHEVMKAIEGMKGKRTILLIAHRLSTVATCDRIVFLHNGRIDAIGSYSELVVTHEGFRHLAYAHQRNHSPCTE